MSKQQDQQILFKNNHFVLKINTDKYSLYLFFLQVIQFRSRENARVNFNTTWDAYKNGFGDVHQNYWLGTL